MTYQYRVDGLIHAPAQVAGEMCHALEQSPEGLSAKTLLNANRAKSAPLHDEFDWNNESAAEKYRLVQAQSIIRNIMIVHPDTENKAPVRAFINVTDADAGRSYTGLARVLNDETLRSDMLRQAKKDMDSFIYKYQTLTELSAVFSAMRNVS